MREWLIIIIEARETITIISSNNAMKLPSVAFEGLISGQVEIGHWVRRLDGVTAELFIVVFYRCRLLLLDFGLSSSIVPSLASYILRKRRNKSSRNSQ